MGARLGRHWLITWELFILVFKTYNSVMSKLIKRILILSAITGILGLMTIIGIGIYFNYFLHLSQTQVTSEVVKDKKPLIQGYKIITQPSSDLTESFKQNDFDSILAFIASRTPESEWLQHMGGVAQIQFIDSIPSDPFFSQRTAVTFLTKENYCNGFLSDCFNISNYKPHIFINSDIKKYQPYSVSSIIMHEMRHVYNYVNNQQKPCLQEEEDAYKWAAKYWSSLATKEKGHINGFYDELSNEENVRLQSYQEGNLSEKVKVDYKSICK